MLGQLRSSQIGLVSHFGPLRRFADRVPWERGPWKSLKAEVISRSGPAADEKTPGPAKPAVHIYGLRNGGMAVAWIQNAESHWKNLYDGKPVPVLRQVEIAARDLPAGLYRLEWWDTWKGEVVRREEAASANGELRLKVPELPSDVAVYLFGEKERGAGQR